MACDKRWEYVVALGGLTENVPIDVSDMGMGEKTEVGDRRPEAGRFRGNKIAAGSRSHKQHKPWR
jgi:hypothetical protein